jgi:uncharacterized cupredoxin-like copper-binding protein
MTALRWIGVLGLGVGLTLTACGGDDGDTGDTAADGGDDVQTLEVTARDNLTFDPDALTATAGPTRIVMDNAGSIVHTFVIDQPEFKLTDDDEGEIDLAAGEYEFYCDVPGHRDGGMEGVLTVTP